MRLTGVVALTLLSLSVVGYAVAVYSLSPLVAAERLLNRTLGQGDDQALVGGGH